MNRYQIDPPIDADTRDEKGQVIARAVLSASQRDINKIELLGLTDMLKREGEGDEIDTITEGSGIVVDEMELYGMVCGTPENIEAILSLFSGALFKAVFYDNEGDIIFARNDSSMMDFYLDDDEFDEFTRVISEEEQRIVEQRPIESQQTPH